MHPARFDRIVWQLKSFFGAGIRNVEQALDYATGRRWERIIDNNALEQSAPSGKLPYDDYAAWHPPFSVFLRACASEFTLPAAAGAPGSICALDAFVDGGDERLWLNAGLEIFGCEAEQRIEEASGLLGWYWGNQTSFAPIEVKGLRLTGPDFGVFRFTWTHTRLDRYPLDERIIA
jgi:hypothetical protein